MPASSLILAALCALPVVPVKEQPKLTIGFAGPQVEFRVTRGDQIFLGGVIASLSPQMTHYFTGLPPLLTDSILLGAGVGYPDGGFSVYVAPSLLPAGVTVYGQGVTLTEGIEASPVETFTLAVAKPADF